MTLSAYAAPYRLLLADLSRALEYVEPSDGHESVYSLRLYEILLRASTEFESICKDACRSAGIGLSAQPSIGDYRPLLDSLKLRGCELGLVHWRPSGRFIQPFAGWEAGKTSLAWYAGYNKVKHSRMKNFHHASLWNVLHAMAAVFAVLATSKLFALDEPPHVHHENSVEFRYAHMPFSLKTTETWPHDP